mmetsp:Transcript_15438/g.35466  ORF Transcript_15438/g.35466 Transcript_15438/m.35466 type:complete len:130 (-) Transcript_15438:198-587(-)
MQSATSRIQPQQPQEQINMNVSKEQQQVQWRRRIPHRRVSFGAGDSFEQVHYIEKREEQAKEELYYQQEDYKCFRALEEARFQRAVASEIKRIERKKTRRKSEGASANSPFAFEKPPTERRSCGSARAA